MKKFLHPLLNYKLLEFASYKNFILYQMDVKNAFLNGQTPEFENFDFSHHVIS